MLVLDADRLLLVRKTDPRTGEEHWIPPDGGEPGSVLRGPRSLSRTGGGKDQQVTTTNQ